MARQPATRARSAQDALAALDDFEPGLTARVRARIPAASLDAIDTTARTGWVPFADDKWVPRATIDELGIDRATAYWRGFLVAHMQTPLLRTILEGALRMFGLTPAGLVKVAPRAWGLVFRDHCRLDYTRTGDTSVNIRLHDVAREVIEWEPYPISFRAFLHGLVDIAKTEGDVTMDVDLPAREIRYAMRWR